MLHRRVSNVHTKVVRKDYVEVFFNLFVGPAMLFVTGGDFLFEGIYLLKLGVNFLEVVVHLDVVEEGKTVVLIC
jgi:hypothetical protein